MPDIAIAILNFNGRHHLERFLPSVVEYSPDCEIYIGDNASTDNSISYVEKEFPEIKLIRFEENYGFCRGYNKLLNQIDATYYVILNSDVEVTSGWLIPLKNLLDNNKDIVACQPKILSANNRNELDYSGAGGGFIDFLGYPFCRGRIFTSLEKDHGQYDDTLEVFWVSGACLFIRSEEYHRLGGFDEDYFAHMEEIDLCWRIHNLGKKVYYCGSSTVFHLGGGTLPKTNPLKTYLNFKNNLSTLYKNSPPESLHWRLLFRLFWDFNAAMKFLFFDSYQDFKSVIRAEIDFYWEIKKIRQKRKKINPRTPRIKSKLIYPRLIVWDYFFLGRKKYSELV